LRSAQPVARVPASPNRAAPAAATAGATGAGTPDWDLPFAAEQRDATAAQRRFDPTRWVLGLVAVGVVVGLVIAINTVLSPFRGGEDTATNPPAATTTPAPATEPPADDEGAGGEEAPATAPPVIAGISSIDPSDGDGEHEELVGRLVDGDPATTWYTHTYNRPDFAGFKDAVGLVITLQEPATVTSVTLDGLGAGGNVEVRSTDAANPTAGDVLAGGALATPQTVLTLAQPTETQSIVLWFTSLSQTPDGANKVELSNVAVS
ncbi:discoidin domain-containing protein, partial [Cellulomonas triticagri]